MPKFADRPARLSGGMRPVRLMLDSGSNSSCFYNTSQYMVLDIIRLEPLGGSGADGEQHTISALPPQNVKMGSVEPSRVPFLTPCLRPEGSPRNTEFDGPLTMGLFRHVFIGHADHFVVLKPR